MKIGKIRRRYLFFMPLKGQRNNLVGNMYGKLIVLMYHGSDKRQSLWECQCECGKVIITRGGNLTSGNTQSCGCSRAISLKGKGIVDLTGKKYGGLTVLGMSEQRKRENIVYWDCLCSCGNIKSIPSDSLKNGKTKSCGCVYQRENPFRKRHGMFNTRPYRIWVAMKQRCENNKAAHYKDYGGRGIVVCDAWHKFENFWEDMKDTYQDELTLDRKNNNGNYEKGNCRWATNEQQHNNTRSNILIEYNGEVKTHMQWARERSIGWKTLEGRLKSGWSVERALMTTTQKYNKIIKHA